MLDFFSLGLTNAQLVSYSVLVIEGAVVVIVVCGVIILVASRKSPEQKKAMDILSSIKKRKEGKSLPLKVPSSKAQVKKDDALSSREVPSPSKPLEIKKGEFSLKQLLIKKFSPKIESQLGSKVLVLDFNAQGENFLALIVVADVKLLLTLDSSGRILDYKKVKN